METPPATSDALDGRRARRERSRQAVLDAVIDLLQERGRAPSTAEVAARSGVSPASVFRYFESLDELQHEATRHHFDRTRPLFEVPDAGVGDLGPRIERFVDSRLELHAHIAPVARFGRSRALDRPDLADSLRRVRRWQSDLARAHFAPELDGLSAARSDDLVTSIGALTSFEAWDQQVSDLGRSPRQVRRAWIDGLTRLLA